MNVSTKSKWILYMCVYLRNLAIYLNWQTSLENKLMTATNAHTRRRNEFQFFRMSMNVWTFVCMYVCITCICIYCTGYAYYTLVWQQREIQFVFNNKNTHWFRIRILLAYVRCTCIYMHYGLGCDESCTKRTRFTFSFFFESRVFSNWKPKEQWQWTIYRIICFHT